MKGHKFVAPLIGVWLVMAGFAFAQKNKRPAGEKLTMKTARLHINGFTKSKSGAV